MNAKQILIAVLLAFLTSFLNGQILIESNVQQSLNDELKSKFDEFFLKNPAYESFGIIKFNSSDQAKPVDFVSLNYNAVGEELEIYEMTYFKSDSLNGNYWEGKSQDKSCSFSFFSNNAGYFGTINRNNYSQILRVFPLDSITSIAVQASSYLEIKDLSCGTQFVSECIPNLDFCGDNPMDNSGCEGNCAAHIEFLFLVSNEASDYYGSNEMTAANIRMMMSDLELAWENSKIENTVSYDWVEYDFSISADINCDVLATDLACQRNDVKELRSLYGADIVVLLGAPDVVWDDAIACVPLVGPYSDAAFVIQPVHTAFLGYTFVHEIGHLFGCNHQFGSAWRNCCGLGRTLNLGPGVTVNSIMKGGRDVIPYFTDPEIEYLGVSTGSFNPNSGRMDNNAGRIRTNSCIVSSFIESTQPFASISLQRSNCQIFASSLYNTVVENDDSYSFEWFLTLEGEFLPDNLDSYISLGEGEEIFITDNQVGDPCVNYFIHLAVMRYQQVIFHQSEIIKGGICTDNVWCGPEGEDSEIKSKTDLDSDIHLSNSTIQSIEYYDLYGSPVLTLKDEDIIGFSRKVNYLKGVIIRIVNFSDGTRSTSKHIYLNR